ncbi:MAG: diacylglycerol kinase family protein [Mariniphaga sp.]
MNQSFAREKILFIINPVSGTKYKGHLPELIKRLIDTSIFDAEVIFSKYKGEATEIVVRKSGEGYRYFVAVGGDGTVNEIAKALINTEAILGILPIGSGNGLARHLCIPLQPENAIQLINKQKIQTIDYGMINNVPFFCTCGVGFDALIGEKFAQSKGRGLYNYFKTTVMEFYNYKPENYKITIDNQPSIHRTAFLITVANASQYGNNAYIAPDADLCDNQLDICILSPFRLYQAPVIGIRLFLKNINKSPLMYNQRANKIRLERASEGVIHFDGEPVRMERTLDLSVINKGLNVIIP